MSLSDPYLPYVASAYGATIVIVGGIVWQTLRASVRARREMDEAERERRG